MQILQYKERENHYQKKLNEEKSKARRFLHAQAAARRKDKLIETKNSQISMLTDQL